MRVVFRDEQDRFRVQPTSQLGHECRAKIGLAETPAPVMTLPSRTTRPAVGIASNWVRRSRAIQCEVARLPLSRPAAPKTSEPVQTLVT